MRIRRQIIRHRAALRRPHGRSWIPNYNVNAYERTKSLRQSVALRQHSGYARIQTPNTGKLGNSLTMNLDAVFVCLFGYNHMNWVSLSSIFRMTHAMRRTCSRFLCPSRKSLHFSEGYTKIILSWRSSLCLNWTQRRIDLVSSRGRVVCARVACVTIPFRCPEFVFYPLRVFFPPSEKLPAPVNETPFSFFGGWGGSCFPERQALVLLFVWAITSETKTADAAILHMARGSTAPANY